MAATWLGSVGKLPPTWYQLPSAKVLIIVKGFKASDKLRELDSECIIVCMKVKCWCKIISCFLYLRADGSIALSILFAVSDVCITSHMRFTLSQSIATSLRFSCCVEEERDELTIRHVHLIHLWVQQILLRGVRFPSSERHMSKKKWSASMEDSTGAFLSLSQFFSVLLLFFLNLFRWFHDRPLFSSVVLTSFYFRSQETLILTQNRKFHNNTYNIIYPSHAP